MFCPHQYLSINPTKSLPRPLLGQQSAQKLEKIINMNANISETIEDRELGFQI